MACLPTPTVPPTLQGHVTFSPCRNPTDRKVREKLARRISRRTPAHAAAGPCRPSELSNQDAPPPSPQDRGGRHDDRITSHHDIEASATVRQRHCSAKRRRQSPRSSIQTSNPIREQESRPLLRWKNQPQLNDRASVTSAQSPAPGSNPHSACRTD